MTIWLVVLGLILTPLALAVGRMIHFFAAEEWQAGSSLGSPLPRRDERERRSQCGAS